MKKLVLLIVLSTLIVVGFGQTPIEGMINSDVTLTKEKSPYLVTGDVVVFPKWQLTIEPGVEVRFGNGFRLQIRGTLVALGTETDSISFISHTGTTKGLWYGIDILNTLGGNASFDYCNFSHASTAIKEECCWGGVDKVKNSRFTFNTTALGGYTGNSMLVENCYFANNEKCITNADKMVNHCIFENNEYGLYMTERVSVSHSTFTNHSKVALYGGRGNLTNCIVTDNNIGVRAFYEGLEIDNCDISNNQVGVELDAYYNGTFWYVAPVANSKICNNAQYNVKNNSICDVDIYTVCWCTSDSTTVENLIYDAYDNLYVGFVNYTLFTDDCSRAIFKTHKAEGYVEYLSVQDVGINANAIYPNPASSTLFIKNDGTLTDVRIYDNMGRLVINYVELDNEVIELNVSDFSPGLYVVRLMNRENKIEAKKVIITR
ncbi:MAG: T9SS type A sorting domain-containing protein [Bacteroidales bacterium]|nr:T9SS type A sorting domain-containing protein [Bacteroidales bacterium]